MDSSEQTTSSLLPSSTPPSLANSLHLADLIRSSSITPVVATKSLLKRLTNENPNVQLLAVQVIDICVKNGGNPFLLAISDSGLSEFPKELEAIVRGSGNREVKDLAKAKLQDWAGAFEGKESLRESDLGRSYRRLIRDGFDFPERDPNVTAAMVDSLSVRSDHTDWQREHGTDAAL